MSNELANLILVLLTISLILMSVFTIYLMKFKTKKRLVFWWKNLSTVLVVWILGSLLMVLWYRIFGYTEDIFVSLSTTGLNFFSVLFFITGIVYAQPGVIINKKLSLLFIVPIVSTIIVWTNPLHNIMYNKYAVIISGVDVGKYYFFNAVYSYLFILVGLYYYLSSSIRSVGFFSKQSLLIVLASILPIGTSIIFNFNIIDGPTNTTSIAFAFTSICLLIAVFKYEFLKLIPVALQLVVDRISDSYIVIDEQQKIIDFNKTFFENFKNIVVIKRKNDVCKILKKLLSDQHKICEYFKKDVVCRETIKFDTYIELIDKYYLVEVTPIIRNSIYIGTIILFKDITEHKHFIETMDKNHKIMMEKERLASLGQFIGGIAHNLRTPIMSISGSIQAVDELINEYMESIGDNSITNDDHYEISKEMKSWIEKIRPTVLYISDVISTVKAQAVNPDNTGDINFKVSDLVRRIEILMDHELRLKNCNLRICNNLEKDVNINGDITCLIQIFNNIIINAADVYGKNGGNIKLKIIEKDKRVLFSIKDYGKGISDEVQNKLFKEMVTTKGMSGTGLGLYISFSNVRAIFNGEMWFETEKNNGTTFFILI